MQTANMEKIQDSTLTIDSADALYYSLEIAGVGVRTYAFVIDWHIRLLFALLWIFVAMMLLPDLNGIDEVFSDETGSTAAAAIIFLPAAIGFFFYHPLLEVLMRGRTPGKRIAGIRLVTARGHIPGSGSLLIRNIFRIIDSLPAAYTVGVIFCIFTKNHIRIGDMAAGTILIYENKTKSTISDIIEQTLNTLIPADDYELLIDITERWKQLLPENRLQLGHQFLKKIGDDFHTENDRELKKHLVKLKDELIDKSHS